MCSTKIEKCLYLRTKRVPAISQNPIPIHRELSFHRPVPIQSYQHQSFSLIHISASRPGNSRGRWGRRRRHVSPRCRLGHPSVRVGGRHTLAAPARVCSPVASFPPHSPRQQPSPCTAPARAHPATLHPPPLVSHPSLAAADRPAGDQDPSRPRYPSRKDCFFAWSEFGWACRGWNKAWFFVRTWFSGYGAARVVEAGLVSWGCVGGEFRWIRCESWCFDMGVGLVAQFLV
jgi:hypothetical protein